MKPPVILLFFSFIQNQGLSNCLDMCEMCQTNLYNTPFYCSIKPDLAQCVGYVCPKICEDSDMPFKIGQTIAVPNAIMEAGIKMFPHPPHLPRAGAEYFVSLSSSKLEAKQEKIVDEMEQDMETHLDEVENDTISNFTEPTPYNDTTCELPDFFEEVTKGSKYIKYRSMEGNKSYMNIFEIAQQYGLVMAEIRRPEEVSAIKPLLMDLASYGGNHPRIYYAYGFRDVQFSTPSIGKKHYLGKREAYDGHGYFVYLSDNSNITYSFIDPRLYGRTDNNCGALTHITGSNKREYLVTIMIDCDEILQGDEVLYGLFMYPPGSLCHRRSVEECTFKKQMDMGGDAVFHNMIQIGQTSQRFIYFYSDQRTWADAKAFCEAKGLFLLDLDPRWDDALRTAEVVKHFLDETFPPIQELHPATMFWTSGQFANNFSDTHFYWRTKNTKMKSHYRNEQPPYEFRWWDDQPEMARMFRRQPHIPRRKNIHSPCVALALNPENNGERPLINFKAWYCDFPMFFLCYKEITAPDSIEDGPFVGMTNRSRPEPSEDSCEMRNVNETEPKPNITEHFDNTSCFSNSKVAIKLHTYSKYVEYKPNSDNLTVEEIKKKCYDFNLVPAEIRHVSDWLSITGSRIVSVLGGGGDTDYFYAIGTEDIGELGKYHYTDSKDPITFSMFYSEGKTETARRCVVLDTVQTSYGNPLELMMHHVDCMTGSTLDRVVYGLCMFKRGSKCFKESSEEMRHGGDTYQSSTIASVGVVQNHSIFFNPVQRPWDDAKKFCEKANLSLLDFDPTLWKDIFEFITLFKEKITDKSGLSRVTPIWTSGKLQGVYSNKGASGSWESTKGMLDFSATSNLKWLRYKKENLSSLREGTVQGGCVEATFDDDNKVVKLRPDYCNVPKFFLCYRKTRKRCCDPPPSNGLGIYIIDTGDGDWPDLHIQGPPQDADIGTFPNDHGNRENQFVPPDGEAESDEESGSLLDNGKEEEEQSLNIAKSNLIQE